MRRYTAAAAQPGVSALSSPELLPAAPGAAGAAGTGAEGYWAATISRALPFGGGPDLFGVVAVTYRFSALARMLRAAVSLGAGRAGCADDGGPECFLVDRSGVVVMDRRLLALDAQPREELSFHPELHALYEIDPFVFESLVKVPARPGSRVNEVGERRVNEVGVCTCTCVCVCV